MVADDPVLALLCARIRDLAAARRPVLVGFDGPVAVGKSTLARALAARLAADGLPAAVVSADGFLLPGAVLAARGLIGRKGRPESFDRPAMVAFLRAAAEGRGPDAPAYDHAAYDPSPTARQPTAGAAAILFEGVNVLAADLRLFYDLTVYLDASEEDAEAYFLQRFVATPFSDLRAAALAPWRPADGDPAAWGRAVWRAVNRPNWREAIAANRQAADLVICKAGDHRLRVVGAAKAP